MTRDPLLRLRAAASVVPAIALETPHGQSRPDSGLREHYDGWLRNDGTHHEELAVWRRAASTRVFRDLLGFKFVQVRPSFRSGLFSSHILEEEL